LEGGKDMEMIKVNKVLWGIVAIWLMNFILVKLHGTVDLMAKTFSMN
jgi:hypothetical protein